jgi:hypothetical protein
MNFGTVPASTHPAGFTTETRIGRYEADQDPISGSSAWSQDLVYYIPYLLLEYGTIELPGPGETGIMVAGGIVRYRL